MPIGIEIRNAETVGVVPKWTFWTSTCGIEDQRDADDHEQRLGGEVGDREEDVEARRLLDAADVEQREHDAEAGGDDDLARSARCA